MDTTCTYVVTVVRSEPSENMSFADVWVLDSASPKAAQEQIRALYNTVHAITVAGLTTTEEGINRWYRRKKREPKIDRG